MKMVLEFFHKDGNLATLGGIGFLLKQLKGSDFTNDTNLSRCGLTQKGSCFFPVFSGLPFLPLPGTALMLALFCSESEQAITCLNTVFLFVGIDPWSGDQEVWLEVHSVEQPAFILAWGGTKTAFLMLENSLCWNKFLIFQCPLQKKSLKLLKSYQPWGVLWVWIFFVYLFFSLICHYMVGKERRKGFINTVKTVDSFSHPEPSI